MLKYILFPLCILLLACAPDKTEADRTKKAEPTPNAPLPEGLGPILDAHQAEKFNGHHTVAFDILLFFGGSERLNATVSMRTNSTSVRIDDQNGETMLFNANGFFTTQGEDQSQRARFAVLTWPYFFAAPFKLNDPGTKWKKESTLPLFPDSDPVPTYLLTFDANVGDSPDDWYLVYKNPQTHLVEGMAYIVTFNASVEEAESEPHAITYHDYMLVDGIPIAQNWKFWMWEKETGNGDQLGEATISNVRFIKPEDAFFDKDKIEGLREIVDEVK